MAKQFASRLSLVVPNGNGPVDVYPLIVKLTGRVWGGRNIETASFEDAISESVVTVLRAKNRHNGGPVKLSTFAYRRIIGGTKDFIISERRYSSRFIPTDPSVLPQKLVSSEDFIARLSNRALFEKVMRIAGEKLLPEQVKIIHLFYLKECPERLIAEELRIPVKRVGLLRLEALDFLRKSFQHSKGSFFISDRR